MGSDALLQEAVQGEDVFVQLGNSYHLEMKTSKEENGMFSFTTHDTSPFIKFGLSVVGVCCLLAGPAQAQESEPLETSFVGTGYDVFEYDPSQPGPDFALHIRSSIRETADNILGPSTCSLAGSFPSQYLGPTDPPAADVEGVCDAASAFISSYSYENSPASECRLKNTGETYTSAYSTGVSCVPFSCSGEEPDPISGHWLPQAGCTSTLFLTQTHVSEAWEGTFETVQKLTYEAVEWDAARGLVVARGSIRVTGTSSVTLNPDEELPANDVTLEVPASGSTMSGIGLISGWSCLGGTLEAEISDTNGVITSFPLPHGTSRADTESVCGDSNNGFSATVNWSLFDAGAKNIRLIQNGEEVASQDFSVVSFGSEFISGASGMCSIGDFPAAGQGVTVEWDETQQRFAVTEIN